MNVGGDGLGRVFLMNVPLKFDVRVVLVIFWVFCELFFSF